MPTHQNHFTAPFRLDNQTVCMHARTKQNAFPVGSLPPPMNSITNVMQTGRDLRYGHWQLHDHTLCHHRHGHESNSSRNASQVNMLELKAKLNWSWMVSLMGWRGWVPMGNEQLCQCNLKQDQGLISFWLPIQSSRQSDHAHWNAHGCHCQWHIL